MQFDETGNAQDVGVEDTALCVVDLEGAVLLQTEVPTDPQATAHAVKPYRRTFRRVLHLICPKTPIKSQIQKE